MPIKKFDYVEVNYTGKLKDDNLIFDTTDEKVAKDAGLYDKKTTYTPIVVCIGKHHLVKGLDEQIIGKELGKYTFQVKDVDAFGKKDPKALKLMPMSLFIKEQIKPFPGLEVNIDNQFGVVKSVSGGRVIVDFNHPLSSKDLVYDIEIIRIVTDPAEKIRGLFDILRYPYVSVDVTGDTAIVTTDQKTPDVISNVLIKDITDTTGVKTVEFKTADKKKENAEAKESMKAKETADPDQPHDHAGHDHTHHEHEGHDHSKHGEHKHEH